MRRGAIGVLAAVLLVCAGPAWGARPAKGAHFYGFLGESDVTSLGDVSADLRVSRSGRTFGRSELEVVFERSGCPGLTVKWRLVGIRRDGTFSLRRPRLRLRGRFLTPDYGRLTYRAQTRRGRRLGRVCRTSGTVALYRNGEPPFSGCRTQRAKTLVRTPSGRIFKQNRLTRQGSFFPHVYACLFETDTRVLLGQDYDDESIDVPRLAGPFVAFASVGCGVAGCTSLIEVFDLRGTTRTSLEQISSVNGFPENLRDLELKDSGSLAWIVGGNRSFVDRTEFREVWVLDRRGQRMLDSGLAIESTSLTISGSTLTWRNGGVVRSATID